MSYTGNNNFKQFSQSLIGLKLKKNRIRNKEENKKEDNNNNDQLSNLINKLKESQMKINTISNSIIGDVYINQLNPIQEETYFNNIPLAKSKLMSIEEENDDNNNINNDNNNNINNNNNDNNNNINNNINQNNNNYNNDFNYNSNYNNNLSPIKLKSVSKSVFNNNLNPINKLEDDIDTNIDFTIINYFKYNDKKEFLEEKKKSDNKKIEEELLRRKKENDNLKKEIEEIQKQREEQERKNKENEEKLKKQIEENEIKKKEEERKELIRKKQEEEEERERKINEEEIRLQREILEKENEEEKKIQRIKQERLEREEKERLEKERKEKEKLEKEKLENELNNKNNLDDDFEIQEISNSNIEEEIQTNNNIFKSPQKKIIEDEDENENENDNNNNNNNKENSSNNEIKLELNEETKKEIDEIKQKNQDLLSKLNADEKNEIDKVINNIYSFDTDHPDLSKKDSFYIIKSLDKDDNELNDLIDDFDNIIKLENKDITKKRRKNFLNKNYFSYKIDFNSKFQQFMTSNRLPHPNYMNKAYQSCNFKEELPNIKNNFEDEIFTKNNLIDNILSPIGNLENFETFVYKYSLNDNYKLMISANKNFNLWRKSLFDGNSFYRVFMFCLIENYILNNNIKELEILIAELIYEKNIELYNKNNIDTETFLIILSGLRKYLNENQIEKTYDLFLKSYLLKNQCFDKALIIYLRNVIFKYLNEVYQEEELYYKENKLTYKNKKINLEAIKFFGIEPEFLILNYITYLYNVNLKILWIDSDFNNPKDNIIPIIDNDSDFILITIGFFFSGYIPLYDLDLSKNNILQKKISENNISIKQLTYLLNEKKKCNICKEKTNQLIFLQKKFIICNICLRQHIKDIFYKRGVSLINNKFNGIEYSTRPIHLEKKYYIEEDDLIEILENSNTINQLNNTITTICVSCKEIFKINQLSCLKCLCRYCEKCLIEKSNNVTNNLKILNKYEKKTFSRKFCQCGNIFDFDDAINYRKDITNDDINNAKERMEIYIKTLCMKCLKTLNKFNNSNNNKNNNNNNNINNIETQSNEEIKDNNKNNNKNNNNKDKLIQIERQQVIKIKKENASGKGLNYSDIAHVMCIDCYYKRKKKEMDSEDKLIQSDNDLRNKKEKDKKINCSICCKTHYIDFNSLEKNERGCCNACFIY